MVWASERPSTARIGATSESLARLPGGTDHDKSHDKRHQVGADFHLLILAWTLFAALPSIFDLSRQEAALGLTALVLFPLIATWISTRQLLIADPLIVVGLAWILAASLPALVPGLYKDPIWLKTSAQSLDAATLWMYRGWSICSVFYWGAMIIFMPARPAREASLNLIRADDLRLAIGAVGVLACLAFLIRTGGQSYTHIDGFSSSTGLDQLITELRHLSKVYLFLFFFAQARRRIRPIETWLLAVLLLAYIAIFSATGSKAVAIELAAMAVMGRAAAGLRKTISRDVVVGLSLAAFVFVTFSFVTLYRQELVRIADVPASSLSEAVTLQAEAAASALENLIGSDEAKGGDAAFDLRSVFDRLALVVSFATMLDLTGGVSPYENASQSFLAPLYAVLPRTFFGDKAQFFDSGNFAGLLGWRFGGFSVSLPGSIFWAWGFEGILPAMAVLGLGLATARHLSQRDGPVGLVWQVGIATLVLGLLNVGMAFQPLIISVVRAVVVTLMLWVLVGLVRPNPRSAFRRRGM